MYACMNECMYDHKKRDLPYLMIKLSLYQKIGRQASVDTVVQRPYK